MKNIASNLIFFLLLLFACKKDEKPKYIPDPNAEPYDYRNPFTDKYEMTFSMTSVNNYLNQSKTTYTGVATVTLTARVPTAKDSIPGDYPSELDSLLVLDGVPFLHYEDGSMYQTRLFPYIDSKGSGGLPGYYTCLFKGDSIFVNVYFGFCYAKYYSCVTNGSGKRIQ
jgi:hypothetical protein